MAGGMFLVKGKKKWRDFGYVGLAVDGEFWIVEGMSDQLQFPMMSSFHGRKIFQMQLGSCCPCRILKMVMDSDVDSGFGVALHV